MSTTTRFYNVQIGQEFERKEYASTFKKVSKSQAQSTRSDRIYPVNSQEIVAVIETAEVPWQELNKHTTEFTETQLAGVIEAIIERASSTYGSERIDADRLRKGLYCAHRTKPIRLIALLHACNVDFPSDVLYGVYRHYDPTNDTIRGGWTAQHSEPHVPGIFELLFGND